MKKNEMNKTALGITYQMSLDAFLQESHHLALHKSHTYEIALDKLKELKQYRSWSRKREIAKEAISICEDCIEAYMSLGMYHEDIFETLRVYKEGMELATMNLGKDYFNQSIHDFYQVEETRMFFHMKFAYACALYEAGFMRKALMQFQEILSLNPSDVLTARYYVFALYLYFEELEKFQMLYERFSTLDTFTLYAYFLYQYKRQHVVEAHGLKKQMLQQNPYLYAFLSNERMNTYAIQKVREAGSEAEAAFAHAILYKVTETLTFLPSFLGK